MGRGSAWQRGERVVRWQSWRLVAWALVAVVALISGVPVEAQTPPQVVPPVVPQAGPAASAIAADDLAQRAKKARELAHNYSEKLRTSLADALKAGGPVGAIGACNTLAPDLNTSITESSTFEISRTSMRVRNPENAPDAWEQVVLEQFQAALTAGRDPKTLETFDVVTTQEGQRLFRYMRPITMREPSCLLCHGPNVAQDVKAEIAKYYNDDKAVGFNLGELRGAFSLVQQLD